jgi:phosphoenolpyruvate carboxykinase (ATP)
MPIHAELGRVGLAVAEVLHNASPARLYEEALRHDGALLAANGALVVRSGVKTGRSPRDKRVVDEPAVRPDVWWGDVNIRLSERTFLTNRQRAVDFLNTRPRLYVVDGFAGWDPRYRLKVRVICARPYHALFMQIMLIRPSEEERRDFGTPDLTIYNAGQFPANPYTEEMSSTTSVEFWLSRGEMVILGTEYAGEMKKGVFTVVNYLLPQRGVLSMHCAANQGPAGDVTLFFGLSGTGKTTLSADRGRRLIGDDEHGWSDQGIFNIEGGCYAKCLGLSPQGEPEIYQAIRFGTVLENVVCDPLSRLVDFSDASLTENTRAAYPIHFIPNVKLPCTAGHPRNLILLTCDAFGVLPPVARLTMPQAMYHFISGYTARIAGTEQGVREPQAVFSACYGAAFLVWHPTRYAELLAERLVAHGTRAWLVNTGWTGGAYGTGRRMPLGVSRAIIEAVHAGALDEVAVRVDPVFGLEVPVACPGVPTELLDPRATWSDPAAYDRAARSLAARFCENFAPYQDEASDATLAAGPRLEMREAVNPVG